jgi:hypothetical protein
LASDRLDTVIKALAENVHGLLFVVGAAWLYVGLHRVSPAAADIMAGALLVVIGAWPYLRRAYLARPRPR